MSFIRKRWYIFSKTDSDKEDNMKNFFANKTAMIVCIVVLSVVLILLIVGIANSSNKSIGAKGSEELLLTDEIVYADYLQGVSKEGFTFSAEPQQ